MAYIKYENEDFNFASDLQRGDNVGLNIYSKNVYVIKVILYLVVRCLIVHYWFNRSLVKLKIK